MLKGNGERCWGTETVLLKQVIVVMREKLQTTLSWRGQGSISLRHCKIVCDFQTFGNDGTVVGAGTRPRVCCPSVSHLTSSIEVRFHYTWTNFSYSNYLIITNEICLKFPIRRPHCVAQDFHYFCTTMKYMCCWRFVNTSAYISTAYVKAESKVKENYAASSRMLVRPESIIWIIEPFS